MSIKSFFSPTAPAANSTPAHSTPGTLSSGLAGASSAETAPLPAVHVSVSVAPDQGAAATDQAMSLTGGSGGVLSAAAPGAAVIAAEAAASPRFVSPSARFAAPQLPPSPRASEVSVFPRFSAAVFSAAVCKLDADAERVTPLPFASSFPPAPSFTTSATASVAVADIQSGASVDAALGDFAVFGNFECCLASLVQNGDVTAEAASALKRALIVDASAMLLKVTHAQLPSEPPQVAHVTSRVAAAKPHDAANVSFAAPASCIASAPLAQPGAVAPVSASASAPSAAAAPPVSAPDYGKKIFEIENVPFKIPSGKFSFSLHEQGVSAASKTAAVCFKYSQVSAVILLFEKSLGSTHLVVSFNEGVLVGKTLLHSVLVSSVKGDTLCDFECGTSDVARAQAVWQRLQMRCGAGCLKAHSDNDLAAVSQPFVRCYAKNVNDGKLWLLKNCIVFEPRPVRVITRNDIRLFSVNRSGASTCEIEVVLTDGEKVLFSMVPREGVAAIETLLSSWSGAGTRAQDDGGSGGSSSSSDGDSEYMDSDDESASSSGSSSGSGSSDDSGSDGSGGSSSDASDIDKSELDALLDESRDVLGDSAAGGGRPTKRVRR